MKTAWPTFKQHFVPVPEAYSNGRRLRDYRVARKMSLRELARKLDISAPYLSDMERGQRSLSEALFNKAITAIAKSNGKAA